MFLASTVALIALLQQPTTAPSPGSGSNLVKNGSFENGTTTPTDWIIGWTGGGQLRLSRQTGRPAKGIAFLRVESVGGLGYGMASQDLPKGLARVRVSGSAKRQGSFEETFIALQGFKGGKQVFFLVASAPKSDQWESFKAEFDLPAYDTMSVHALIKGTGSLDLDDLVIEDLAPDRTAENNKPKPSLISNSDFELGETTPSDWRPGWVGEGNPILRRLTDTPHSGKAYMRLDTQGSRGYLLVGRPVPAGTKRVKIRAFMRVSGTLEEALLGFRTVNSSGAQQSWVNFTNMKETKWTEVKGEAEIPDGLVGDLMIVIKGTGTLDIDSLSVTAE
ncbi:MAG: hypothetical protein MUC92_07555 [Fimbriimonadaceae bacterium]|jgi:hypothetical protein|nr:hypothetical protein [Fimbriimonadaceae bacterium]